MNIKLGNLSPEAFAARVGAEFTEDELAELKAAWSQRAALTGPEDFHIFEAPSITIHIGSVESRTVEIFKAANERKTFNGLINFYLDEDWKDEEPVGEIVVTADQIEDPEPEITGPPYPEDKLNVEYRDEDDGTMPANVSELAEAVVGHRIVRVEEGEVEGNYSWRKGRGLIISLDNGKQVTLANTDDCCAYTTVEKFLLNVDLVDHIITGVATTEAYTKWHIYADMGDVLALDVGWSPGNPFYYAYGFAINVVDLPEIFQVEDAAIEAKK